MTVAGVGSVVDLPSMSVIVRGLDVWGADAPVVSEPRLLVQVQRAMPGAGVMSLRAAPWDPQSSDDPQAATGVPVTPFPRWLRCPACHQLLPMDGVDQLELVHRWGRRPDLAKWVHVHCPRQTHHASISKRRACIPARFLVACKRGHLDEFPYVDFVHVRGDHPCAGAQLEMRDAGSILGPRVTVACTACKARRNISEAAGSRGEKALPRCRGRHPHLQSFEPCGEPLRLLVLGASNLWFNITLSALHLPADDPVAAAVAEHWHILAGLVDLPPATLRTTVGAMPDLRALHGLSEPELATVLDAERKRRAALPEGAEPELPGILDAEWDLLRHPTTMQADEDFLAVPTPPPTEWAGLLRNVVQVERLREVQASLGFARIDAPDRSDHHRSRAPLAAGHVGWVPALERRGEGIFLELHGSAVDAWCDQVDEHPDVVSLRDAYDRWRRNRDLSPDPAFPVARYLLLHTLSHLLLRTVALECGYSSASIRERLYIGSASAPAAGFLLSTAASDSEGTLGGLVALGAAKFLGRLLDQALHGAETCSSDPLCAERLPEPPSDQLYGAACHACLFLSETSCESGNRWLHRGVLVELGNDLAFRW